MPLHATCPGSIQIPGSVFEPCALPEHRLHGGVCRFAHFDVRRWGELAFARTGGSIEGLPRNWGLLVGRRGSRPLWSRNPLGKGSLGERCHRDGQISSRIRESGAQPSNTGCRRGFSDFGIEHPNDFLVRQDVGQAFNMRKEGTLSFCRKLASPHCMSAAGPRIDRRIAPPHVLVGLDDARGREPHSYVAAGARE